MCEGLLKPVEMQRSARKRIGPQFSLVAQSCPTLCNPMNHSTPGLTVHHQLLEFTQTHVHRVGDAIQPSHPLSSPSPPVPNPSQHQGLFQWVNSAWGGQNTGVSASASVPPKNIQGWSPLEWTGWISLQSKGLSRVFSNATVLQCSAFFTVQLSHPYMTTGKIIDDMELSSSISSWMSFSNLCFSHLSIWFRLWNLLTWTC